MEAATLKLLITLRPNIMLFGNISCIIMKVVITCYKFFAVDPLMEMVRNVTPGLLYYVL